jgi:hypothetical protein
MKVSITMDTIVASQLSHALQHSLVAETAISGIIHITKIPTSMRLI